MHRFLARCIVMLLAVSCGNADSQPASVARDSAGIHIIESTSAQWPNGQQWRLDPEPALSIGVVEGEDVYQFSRVIGLRRFSDGRIAVANQGSDEVRIYDARGQWLRTIGRRGDGPGEFQSLRSLFLLPSDSLLAVSHFGTRYTLFDPALELVRVEHAPMSAPLGRFDDGSFLNARYAQIIPPTTLGHVRDSIIYVSSRPRLFANPEEASALTQSFNPAVANAWPMDTVARAGGNDEYRSDFSIASPGAIANEEAPFGRHVVESVHGQELFTGDGASFEIRVYGRTGGMRRIIRLLEPATPLSAQTIDDWKAGRRSRVRNDAQREHAERVIAAQTFPEAMPAFRSLTTDTDGHLWVERYPPMRDAPPRWAVFDPAGHYLGTLETPPDFRIMEIGTEYLLGIWTDAEDVEFVHMYRLHRAG